MALSAAAALALALLVRSIQEQRTRSAAVAELAELAVAELERPGSPRPLREADVKRLALGAFSPATPRRAEAERLWPDALRRLAADARVAVVATAEDGSIAQLRRR